MILRPSTKEKLIYCDMFTFHFDFLAFSFYVSSVKTWRYLRALIFSGLTILHTRNTGSAVRIASPFLNVYLCFRYRTQTPGRHYEYHCCCHGNKDTDIRQAVRGCLSSEVSFCGLSMPLTASQFPRFFPLVFQVFPQRHQDK